MNKLVKRVISVGCCMMLTAGFVPGNAAAAKTEEVTVKADIDTSIVKVTYEKGAFDTEEASVVCYDSKWNQKPEELSENLDHVTYLDQKSVSSSGGEFSFKTNEAASANQDYYLAVGTAGKAEPVVISFQFTELEPLDGKYVSTADWTNISLGTGNTGVQSMEFDLTPHVNFIDGVVAYSSAEAPMTDWPNMPISLQLSPEGNFNVRNGALYANIANVTYQADKTYHVKMRADLDMKKYSVDITKDNGEVVCIAKDYAFRTGAPSISNIGNILVRGGAGAPSGQFRIQDHKIYKETAAEPADKSKLDEAINNAVPSEEKDKYTADSWDVYAKALQAARDIKDKADAAQDEVDDAVKALTDAQKALKVKSKTPVSDIFEDVEAENWFTGYVQYVYDNNIMKGMNDTHFGPDVVLSRAQFATILYRMENEPQTVYEMRFPDVPDEMFYTDAVMWASGEGVGVILGYADQTFGPGDDITREQMAVMMYRYAKYKGYDVTASSDLEDFRDKASVSGFAEKEMKWAVGAGLIKGDNEKLNPQGTTSRAVCATIIQRFMEAYSN